VSRGEQTIKTTKTINNTNWNIGASRRILALSNNETGVRKMNLVHKFISRAYKPFDVVTNQDGRVGFIVEVNVSSTQTTENEMISYSVTWLTGGGRSSWYTRDELTVHCNLFAKIAEAACHNMGDNHMYAEKILLGDYRNENNSVRR